ncbi:ECF RNA polymerase sigma factor SigE [Thalassoglobus neptunius]|uniref:ECF RNA polymerase sigma factor SigE n=1 Tax=Thalassoglobus neptunius TaxID=1938619 RepID=A0A5C5V0S6_9PLAN|nr:sigma-70 family RNA polymerase sigma factor [Thalassoglobus neptunius]TWT31335.1 ECF RNA polymerase sigma factor SigE [Thalassoglobus neptunius]
MSQLTSSHEAKNHDNTESQEHLSDSELLAKFIRLKSESAFAALVERYGSLVYSVAIRTVRHRQSAEDVTQATFLVLARDAGKVRKSEALAAWLHGVAQRIARKALRRKSKELVSDTVERIPKSSETLEEIQSIHEQKVLDEELQGLPPQYRDALILHFLEGLTYDQTADRLGVTLGVVEGRIKRGKRELRLRLTRRGVGLMTALAAMSWSQEAAAAVVRPELIQTITSTGLAVSQGTAFPGACSPEAVYLAGKEVAMISTAKLALVVCSLTIAVGTGWATHASLASDVTSSGDPFGTVVEKKSQADALDVNSGGFAAIDSTVTQSSTENQDPFGVAADVSAAVDDPIVNLSADVFDSAADAARRLALQKVIVILRDVERTLESEKKPDLDELKKIMNEMEMQDLIMDLESPAGELEDSTDASRAGSGIADQGGASGMFSSSPSDAAAAGASEVPVDSPIAVERDQSPQEERILQLLGETTNLEFPGSPLSDVTAFLSEHNNIPVYIDQKALGDEGLSADDPISINIQNVPLSTGLKLMLEPLDLTYLVKDDLLYITTKYSAEEEYVTRVYDVRSLNIQDPETLADVLLNTVGDISWSHHGGGGDLSFLNGSVIIRQTHAVHDEIETLLNQLAKQIRSNPNFPDWPVHDRPEPGSLNGGFGGMMGGG